MIARLQAFYGGDPGQWLGLRPPVFRALARMLPRLEAERDLKAVQAVAVGTGSMKPEPARRYLDSLRRAAGTGKAGLRPKTAADWKAAGMRVTETERADG